MNILSLIQNQLSPQTIGQISNAVGESPEGTESALRTAFPTLLGSLMGKATTSPGGVTEVFNMIKQGQAQGGGWSDTISKMVGGGTAGGSAGGLLNSLLGSKLGAVSDFIASHSGVRRESVSSLMGMAAPFLVGTIGKVVSTQNLGATGLSQLLASQAEHVKNALPSGLANTLGIDNLLSRGQGVEASTREMIGRTPARVGGGFLKWAWVPIVLAAVAFLMVRQMYRTRTSDMGGTTESSDTWTVTGHAHTAADFANLNLPPGSVADRMAKAITAGNWNQALELPDINADSVDGLSDSARASISQVGSVLSAAPDVKVRITGRGSDNQAALNQANAIKSGLVSSGVGENRIYTIAQTGEGKPTINLTN